MYQLHIVSISTFGDIDFGNEKYKDSFYINSLFVSGNTRSAVNGSQGDYIPIFLSEIPRLFRENYLPLDVAIIHVSPPVIHGFCSPGTSVDVAKAAVETAKIIIAQVNPNMPRVHGAGFVHENQINKMVWVEGRHNLDVLFGQSNVNFRIAFASNGSNSCGKASIWMPSLKPINHNQLEPDTYF